MAPTEPVNVISSSIVNMLDAKVIAKGIAAEPPPPPPPPHEEIKIKIAKSLYDFIIRLYIKNYLFL